MPVFVTAFLFGIWQSKKKRCRPVRTKVKLVSVGNACVRSTWTRQTESCTSWWKDITATPDASTFCLKNLLLSLLMINNGASISCAIYPQFVYYEFHYVIVAQSPCSNLSCLENDRATPSTLWWVWCPLAHHKLSCAEDRSGIFITWQLWSLLC